MKKLKGNWTDIFQGFSVALDFKKLFAAYIGLFLSLIIVFGTLLFLGNRINPSFSLFPIETAGCRLCQDIYHSVAPWKLCLFAGGIYIILLFIWSYFGGIITRIAAINLAKDEGLELNKAIAFTNKKYLSFFAPFIFAILGILFFFFCTVALGLIGRIPFAGEIIVSLLMPLAFLCGFIMVFLLIGLKFGGVLFFPTIAVESSDAFDAVSRSFQYVYAEPWHYIWYCLTALVYGAITTAFVWLFGGLMLYLTQIGLLIGTGEKILPWLKFSYQPDMAITSLIGSYILMVWVLIVLGLIVSYAISYCFSAHTIIYLLLRKKVDDIDMNEVYEEDVSLEEPVSIPAVPAPEAPKPESPAAQ